MLKANDENSQQDKDLIEARKRTAEAINVDVPSEYQDSAHYSDEEDLVEVASESDGSVSDLDDCDLLSDEDITRNNDEDSRYVRRT